MKYISTIRNPWKTTRIWHQSVTQKLHCTQRQPKTSRSGLRSHRALNGEKSFANDIAFIEIGQWEGDDKNQIELYNLKSYIDIEMNN